MSAISHQPSYLPQRAAAHRARTHRPLVTLSYAQSLDGCLTLHQGKGAPVSSPASMRITHRLRAAHDAILVGVGTVLADDPRLTVRLVEGRDPQPVVLDSRLRIPVGAALFSYPHSAIIVTTGHADAGRRAAIEAAGGKVWVLPDDSEGRVNLGDLLDRLGQAAIDSLMVEGGSQVISSFLREGLADRAVITIAPVFAGGYHAVRELRLDKWEALPRLIDLQVADAEGDLIVWGELSQ